MLSVTDRPAPRQSPGESLAAPDRPRAARLPEIDIFRALATCLMGMTHGLFWIGAGAAWTEALAWTGIFFCFTAFLLSFGMSVAILCLRGGLDAPDARRRLVRRALVLLLAYYLVAFGRYAPDVFQGDLGAGVRRCLEFLLLLDIPKAGSFFLAFALFLVLAALLGRRLRTLLDHPALALGGAMAAYGAGCWLAGVLPPSSYGKLFFGATEGARTFPVLPYAPVFVAGLLLGGSYLRSADRRRWLAARGMGWSAALLLGVSISLVVTRTVADFERAISPVPSLPFLIGSGLLSTLFFVLCAVYGCWGAASPSSPGQRFLVYVGRNSIWIIVCQYLWIQLAARMLGLGGGGGVRTVVYLLTMVFVPPLLLFCAQRVGKAPIPGRRLAA